ncbi:MDIS1-interacting receptor like kinase 2 [Citrus sinensis]|uniref:MDIS1-interacting receptor like kinase 2 n=1 Tax=Citrus sinensis TaxID=2711 RepID=A0ACB8I1B9_CITSI|nr:MDIS1-interacting receptor like kinase 2 [Citrus sinensis]
MSTLGLNGTFHDFSFSSFPHLANLNLSFNLFFGNIPLQIGNLSKLQYLDLGSNQLSGLIPPEIGKLNQLRRLYLDMNQLHGTIPPEIGNLSNLAVLYLYKNSLSGSIPSIIGKLKSLLQLDLSENQFSGSIPLSLGNLTSLTMMSLFNHSLSGSIPPMLGNLKSLSALGLHINQLNGFIPPSIGNLSSLRVLYLYNNGLYGFVPEEIEYLKSLSELELCTNLLRGVIPHSIVQLEMLSSLNKLILNLNQLSGGVPLEFGSLTKLQYLDLSANKLSSSIPKSIGNLLKLHYLNLSNNQLSHKIPTEFEKLIHLSELDLSHNILQEEIPPQVCNMGSLEKLNLSHNNLSDFIPRCFEEMRSLSCIDISYNELHGPIPNSTAFKDGLMEGNKGLCGNFEALPSCDAFTSHKQTLKKKWVVIVFAILGIVVLLTGLTGFFFFFQQRKRVSQEEQSNSMNRLRLLSVLNFDGKIMNEEIIKATDDFDEKFCIGKGGQGSVYKAELPSGDIVAVKKFNSQLLSGNMADHDEFLNEVLALKEIRHRNNVKFHGFCYNGPHSFLVCEYLDRGSLARILGDDVTEKELGWNRRINVIKGIANALSYLHHDCLPSIIHRDISTKNVLLDSNFEAHVSDFGIAKFVGPHSSNWTEFAGTFGYAAPGTLMAFILEGFGHHTAYYAEILAAILAIESAADHGLLGFQPSNSTPSTFKRLTPSEVKERKDRGLCYCYDGKYSPSHKSQSPQLFMMDDFHSKDDEEGSGQGAKHD